MVGIIVIDQIFYETAGSDRRFWNFISGYKNELISQGRQFREQMQTLVQTINSGN